MNSFFWACLFVCILMPAIGFGLIYFKFYVDEYCSRHNLARPDYKFIMCLFGTFTMWTILIVMLYKTAYAVGINVMHYFLK